MPPVFPPEPGESRSRSPGDQPLPGYTLLAPLGRGGFGEVWKCEVPGGLHKAVKFVVGDPDAPDGGSEQLRQEYAAFLEMKAIRHPFLLTLERVEVVGNELVMVMELADRHIGERFHECRTAGLPGIPRDELLGYLREAAEVLDVLTSRFGLQHLDVKPANLFLTAGHVQVGDYGLVSKLDNRSGGNRGLTPRYAAPEVLNGQVHTRSDQYSLALVYVEMLTGTFPYNGKSARQLMIQHLAADPDLSALPPGDRAAVGTALAKKPDERFPTCRAFADALGREAAPVLPAVPKLSGVVGRAEARTAADEPTFRTSATVLPGLPKLVTIARRPAPTPEPAPNPPPEAVEATTRPGIYVPEIVSVLPVGWLRGRAVPGAGVTPTELVRAVLSAAGVDVPADAPAGAERRFLTTIDPRLARVKLDLLRDEYQLELDAADPCRVVLRKAAPVPEAAPAGLFGGFSKKLPPPPPSGLEVVVHLPERGGQIGEVVASGTVFGTPPADFARRADRALEKLLDGVRRHLGNVEERRKHPRVPAAFGVTVYPLAVDGRVGTPAAGRCRNVSAGGLSLVTDAPPGDYAYVSFDDVRDAAGLAVLVRTIHQKPDPDGVLVTGRYKLERVATAGAAG